MGCVVRARDFAGHFGVALSAHCAELRRQGLTPPVELLELRDAFVSAAKSVHVRPTGDGRWRVVDDAVMQEKLILTYKEAGDVLGVSDRTVRRLAASGELATVVVNGRRAVHRDDLVAYAASLRKGTVTTKTSVPVNAAASEPAPVDFSPLSMPLSKYVETLERGRDEWSYR